MFHVVIIIIDQQRFAGSTCVYVRHFKRTASTGLRVYIFEKEKVGKRTTSTKFSFYRGASGSLGFIKNARQSSVCYVITTRFRDLKVQNSDHYRREAERGTDK